MDNIAPWISIISLALAFFVFIDARTSRGQDKLENHNDRVGDDIASLQRFKSRYDGADVLRRLSRIEAAQGKDRLLLTRIDERMESVTTLIDQALTEARRET